MTLHFHLKYNTAYGQRIFIISDQLRDQEGIAKIPMRYENDNLWSGFAELSLTVKKPIQYHYLVENEDGFNVVDGEGYRYFDPKTNSGAKEFTIVDTWIGAGEVNNIFYTSPFRIFLPAPAAGRVTFPKTYTHEFRVKAPVLEKNQTICLLGSTPHLNNWDTDKPILMKPFNRWFSCKVQMDENEWPVSYKYGLYNTAKKQFVSWESGENRRLGNWPAEKGGIILHDGFVNIDYPVWKGAGVNIPVFSLRSKKGFGIGEFADLKYLIDWCRTTGIRMIQLLPVNDTSVYDNWKDSYPYSAISAFALHPIYLNLEKVAGKNQAAFIRKLSKKKKQLNDLPRLDYEEVRNLKESLLRELFDLQKNVFKKDANFKKFFRENQDWLVPYASFCYLKERYQTTDFLTWKNYAAYDEATIKKLAGAKQRHYDKIVFYYYQQYHLHLQLLEMVEYAHKNGITLKGDLPIGLNRQSCDVWMHPSLFDEKNQAGAPPDDFATEGQNWKFPTYNWNEMKKDHFSWWKSRLNHMAGYFDAFRVDHILGYFRIWSIPEDSMEGIMGRFVPAVPVDRSEFDRNKIYFEADRYCQPYITDKVVRDLFGEQSEVAAREFLIPAGDNMEGTYRLHEEVNTQQKALQYLSEKGLMQFRKALFSLISNVILFEEKGSAGQKFHFRFGMSETSSFRALDSYLQDQLRWLYNNYFYERQNHLWRNAGMEKLPALKTATGMMMCGEDLGMVPASVPEVMSYLGIPGLHVARMARHLGQKFSDPKDAGYLSIVQPSTHDMSTLREWWQEDPAKTQLYYHQVLGQSGESPSDYTPGVAQETIRSYMNSPAMWSIFLMQDLLSLEGQFRIENPADERINIPSDADHYWRYRMNIDLEDLLKDKNLIKDIRQMLIESGRFHE